MSFSSNGTSSFLNNEVEGKVMELRKYPYLLFVCK